MKYIVIENQNNCALKDIEAPCSSECKESAFRDYVNDIVFMSADALMEHIQYSRKLKDYGVKEICIAGRALLTAENIFAVIGAYSSRNIKVRVILDNCEIARKQAISLVEARPSVIQFSLDSVNEDYGKWFYGSKKNFACIKSSAENIGEAVSTVSVPVMKSRFTKFFYNFRKYFISTIRFEILAVCHEKNMESLPELVDFCNRIHADLRIIGLDKNSGNNRRAGESFNSQPVERKVVQRIFKKLASMKKRGAPLLNSYENLDKNSLYFLDAHSGNNLPKLATLCVYNRYLGQYR